MLRRNKLILGLVCQFAFITSFSSAQETAVQTVIADHWSWYLSQNPVFAGQLGDRSGMESFRTFRSQVNWVMDKSYVTFWPRRLPQGILSCLIERN